MENKKPQTDPQWRTIVCRPKLRCSQICALAIASVFLFSFLASTHAQIIKRSDIPKPLLDEDPFDIIILDEKNDNVMIAIEPVENLRNPLPDTGVLRFEFKKDSEFILEVPFFNIQNYQSFNSLVLNEAQGYLASNNYAKAFRNLLYVYDHGGRGDPRIEEQLRRCLFEDAKENFKEQDFELALSMYEDLYRKDPNYQVTGIDNKLIDIVLACYDGVLNRFFDSGNFDTVESTLESIENRYGKDSDSLMAKWEKRFAQRGESLLKEAQQFAQNGEGRKAHLAIRRAERILTSRPDVMKLQEAIMQKYPLIVVGVSQPAGDANPNRMDHWGARRVGRLTQRTIVELTGLSDEGGIYKFLNGTLTRTDSLGLEYQFAFDPSSQGFGVPELSANQLAMRLLSFGNENSPNYDLNWAKILGPVSIEDGTKVNIQLRTPFIRPEALIRFAYEDRSDDDQQQPTQNGKYMMTSKNGSFATYEVNPLYEKEPDRQHPVIIEQYFNSASEAVDALLRGDVDIVDRISIADLQKIKRQRQVEARAYAVPTVHMLVPKIRGDLAGNVMLRTGLSAAINRDLIVNDIVAGKREVDGCSAISGPFPIGSDDNDRISYGYDLKVKPLIYSSKLGMVRVEIAMIPPGKPPKPKEGEDDEKAGPKPKEVKRPTIVLAHPSSSIAREASLAIAQMWSEIGVETTLRQLDPGKSRPDDDNWDMLYVEATIQEPLVDAQRLLGPTGLVKNVNATIGQTLQDLAYAQTWQSACRKLRTIHRQVSNDLTVIPLYQVKEHYAFRDNVFEMGRDIVHLYQNVERWRIQSFVTEQEVAKGKR